MTAPLSIKAESSVEVENSCNCCIPIRKKKHPHKSVTTVTEEIRHRTIVQVDSSTPETPDLRQYKQLK